MSEITLFSDKDSSKPLSKSIDCGQIQQMLAEVGVNFEQWQANKSIVAGDSQEDIIDAYREDIDRLMTENAYKSVDVVSLTADQPEKELFRQKFLAEHTHSENEVRFFVDGQGLFSLHINDCVYEVLCEKGDLISVPANIKHWFDMGPNPNFVAIRLFTNPEGWVANFTGNNIADRFSRLEN